MPRTPKRRALAADPVFEALAKGILRGEFPVGSALPPERELSARFSVSRLIARQALHRLRGMGLVRGAQGGSNTVLDPDESNDPRLIALTMELAPERTDERDVTERQLLAGTVLLELAQLRITAEEVDQLENVVETMARACADERPIESFESRFWIFVAHCTRNKILEREARWWFDMIQRQPERKRRFYDRAELRIGAYRSIIDNLRSGSHEAATMFRNAVKPILLNRQ